MTATCKEIIHQPVCLRIMAELASPPTEGAAETDSVLQPVATDTLVFDDALTILRTYSLIRSNPEAKTLSMHRLTQAVLRDRMDEDTQRQWAERVVRMVNCAFPNADEEAMWHLCQRYLPHVHLCLGWIIMFLQNQTKIG